MGTSPALVFGRTDVVIEYSYGPFLQPVSVDCIRTVTAELQMHQFVLRHLRVITYLNNGEDLQEPKTALTDRARTLLGC